MKNNINLKKLGFGIVIGVAIGVALKNIAIGIGVGVVFVLAAVKKNES